MELTSFTLGSWSRLVPRSLTPLEEQLMLSQAQLIIQKDGHLCDYEELSQLPTPATQGRWHPVSHTKVLDTVEQTLSQSGFEIASRQLGLTREGKRFFGTLTLKHSLAPNDAVCLAVGIRNSVDKTFPLGFCAGNRVTVCSNLCFRSELLVKRRHTRFGETRFQNAIAEAVQSLQMFADTERERIEMLMNWELSDDQALALMARSVENQIIPPLAFPKLLQEWRNPQFNYGTDERSTAWKLLNCYTTVLKSRVVSNPQQFVGQTIRLNALIRQGD